MPGLQNAELVRERRLEEADLANIAAELELVAGSERRELYGRLDVLILHLLKYQLRPELTNRSWWLTIREQRRPVAKVLRASPSLQRLLAEAVAASYQDPNRRPAKPSASPASRPTARNESAPARHDTGPNLPRRTST